MVRTEPVVAVTLGDPSGIGPELVVKNFAEPNFERGACKVVIVGDEWLLKNAQKTVGVNIEATRITDFGETSQSSGEKIYFLPVNTMPEESLEVAVANQASGKSVLDALSFCLDAAQGRKIDAICFAPLNKHAMKMAGMAFEDELHFFADFLGVNSYFCEFNTLDGIWTSRISSHVPLKDISKYITTERIVQAGCLISDSLIKAGISNPRIAVAALNPHGGDGGTCGREEIEIITPAVSLLKEKRVNAHGPFPADTIFLKVRDGKYDAVVTMYHDQGQIAIKLLGFENGVTVQGGLPIPITTPAHGTAFDIAGENKANFNAMRKAFNLACVMGESQFRENPPPIDDLKEGSK
ncbi:4-hydroxythreonine-4-phosphate dehydrogenase PdxA [Grimontia marina]|uniref:4-hydroxythreonine-4-phosphate dehydrogenase 2 n=1 Tax=Grimontia marina TaxID=646534 RepID=A0A128EYQ0_9GAMM|nr:4-hydroxythreonine-4-phosphate dehydrogenase PdxA [Grimontia marina]CZF79304.1 4-hydroxythreonine-4-phosphate dehydrogenase 2 [Grimontia marina]